jgi:uncharacterized membrane protein YbhN (UPF0104 family)
LLAGVALSFGIFAYALADVRLGEALRLVGRRGPWLLLALLPPALTLGADALAWRRLLGHWGHRPSLLRLWPARVAVEAVALTVPGGTVLGEGFKPTLLGPLGVPVAHAIAAVAAQRWWHMRAHAAFVLVSGLVGYGDVVFLSSAFTGTFALVPSLFVSALSPFVVSLGLEAACGRGSLGARSFALLARALPRRWAEALERRRGHFDATDRALEELASAPLGRLWPAALAMFVAWVLESFDSWVALRVVGAPLSYPRVIVLEGGLSLLRSVAVFAPAGLGVQDLGYLRGLEAFGLSPEAAAAFVLVKRGKDLVWAAMGYLLLALLLRRARRRQGASAAPVAP